MRKYTAVKLLVATVLAIGAAQPWGVGYAQLHDPESGRVATGEATSPDEAIGPGEATGPADTAVKKKKGNGFARAITAPFRAIGRLFGGGKDDNRPRRLTESDVKKFEAARTVRVNDARSPVASAPADAADALAMLAQGRELIERGQLNEAIGLLSRAAAVDPKLAEARHLLGVAFDLKGLPQMAKDSFELALRLAPNDAQTLNDYGYSLYQQGHYEAAVKRLTRAAKADPANGRVWNNLAIAQFRLGKYDDAYKSFARAGGEFKGRMNVAAMLERLGRSDEAIKHYEAARLLAPVSPVVLQHLADLYQRTGRSEKAEAARHAFAAAAGTGNGTH